MGWFTSTPPAGLSVALQRRAAHEIGHAVAFKHYGIPTYGIHVALNDNEPMGGRVVIEDEDITDALMPGYLVGLLAGDVAGDYWSDKHGVSRWKRSPYDATEIKRIRRRARALGLNERKAGGEAKELVRAYWLDIRDLTPVLAKAGRLARV